MDYERQFLEQLNVIDETVRFIGRRYRLTPEAVEELRSSVRLKLIDNDYEVLRRFEGRSSLRTFLSTVVTRHFLDLRTAEWGKWRPCAQARRLGPVAMLLDRLLHRDGYGIGEALEVLRTNYQIALSERELDAMATRLAGRTARRFVGEEELATVAVPPPAVPDLGETGLLRDKLEQGLAAAVANLTAEDRLIVRLRFQQGMQVAEIARLMKVEQKPLYRRVEGLMKRLRQELQASGVQPEQVSDLLDDDVEVAIPWGADAGGSQSAGPSTQ